MFSFDLFCIVIKRWEYLYKLLPFQVTIFNVNGETVWLVDEGYFNEIYYNPFGNVLVTCGFGNISSGKMVFWNVSQRTKIIEHEVRS